MSTKKERDQARADRGEDGNEREIERNPDTPVGGALEPKVQLVCKCGHGGNSHGRGWDYCLACSCVRFELSTGER